MSEFRAVGKVKQFREGRGRTVTVDGEAVAVFRRGDRFFAFTDECPHMGASLAMGRLEGGHVQCAWHEWKFDLVTGKSDMREWACVVIHEVRLQGDDVLIRLGEKPATKPDPEPRPDEDWFKWDPE